MQGKVDAQNLASSENGVLERLSDEHGTSELNASSNLASLPNPTNSWNGTMPPTVPELSASTKSSTLQMAKPTANWTKTLKSPLSCQQWFILLRKSKPYKRTITVQLVTWVSTKLSADCTQPTKLAYSPKFQVRLKYANLFSSVQYAGRYETARRRPLHLLAVCSAQNLSKS